MSAVKFFGENHLQLNNVVAARIGKGLRELPAIKGYTSSIVLFGDPEVRTSSSWSRQMRDSTLLTVSALTWNEPIGRSYECCSR